MTKIVVAPMNARTVADAARLEQECFSSPWSRESLAAELDNPTALFLTAEIAGEIAGYAGMHHILDEGYITNVAVSPSFRRRGVASALLDAFSAFGREHHLAFISLEVRCSNQGAIALYQRHGYEIKGVRKGFYTKPVEDGYIMTLTF